MNVTTTSIFLSYHNNTGCFLKICILFYIMKTQKNISHNIFKSFCKPFIIFFHISISHAIYRQVVV